MIQIGGCFRKKWYLSRAWGPLVMPFAVLSGCHPMPKADNVVMVSHPLHDASLHEATPPSVGASKQTLAPLAGGRPHAATYTAIQSQQLVATSAKQPMQLTLTDAIALSMRHNLNLQSDKLSRIVQKYDLIVAQYNFAPQYSLQGSYTHARDVNRYDTDTSRQASLSPMVSWQSHYGTQVTLRQDNDYTYGHPSQVNPLGAGDYASGITTKVTQALLRGFGRDVVDASLNNAKDTERMNRLEFSANATQTLTEVVANYFSLIEAKQRLAADVRSLARYQQMIAVDKLKIASGQLAAADLIDLQSRLTTTEVTIESDKNSIDRSSRIFLNSVGLESNTPFQLPDLATELVEDEKILTANGDLLNRDKSFHYALQHNVDYQVAGITTILARRNLNVEKNEQRPDLSLELSHAFDFGHGDNLGNSSNLSASLNYDQPINDINRKSGLVSAQVALGQAIITLKQARRDLYNTIHNDIDTIHSLKKQISLGQKAVALQKQNYTIARQKYNHGLISNYNLTDVAQRLLEDQTTLIEDQINYLTGLAAFAQDMNISLQLWHIQIIGLSAADKALRTSDQQTVDKQEGT